MGKGSVSLVRFTCSARAQLTHITSHSKGKDKTADKAAAAEEARRKKVERERLLAEEEASLPTKPKANPKAGAKKAPVKSTLSIPSFESGFGDDPQSFSASGIDDALDMLSLVGSRTDKAAIGSQVSSA